MQIRAKVVALLAVVFAALTLVEWGVGQALLLPRFEEIEIENARTAMRRIEYGINQALKELQVSATDWGNWKDTYQFIADHNPQYVEDNLSPAAMKQLRLAALAYVDNNGRVVLTRTFDPATGDALPHRIFHQDTLPADCAFWPNLRNGTPAHGLIATDRGVLLAAATPILDGFGRGPSRGLVLMGRLLNDTELAAIGDRAQTVVKFAAMLSDPADDGRVVVNGDMTEVFRVFRDIDGKPAMTLRVDVPRTISRGADTTVNYVLAFTVSGAVAVLLVLLVSLDRTVLTPLARVTRHAIRIGAGGDLTKRLNLGRRDEIGVLAAEFDRMVGQVAESRREMIDHSFHAGMAELSRGVLHNIGNAITPLRVRLAGLQDRLRNAPIDDVGRALAERTQAGAGSERRADLDEFLLLASGELAGVINNAASDVDVMSRQVDIVQSALAEQSRSSQAPTVIEATELPAIIDQSLEIVPDRCRERVHVELDTSVKAVGTVHVARTVLRLVLQNLIINASEAIRAAGRDRGIVRFSASLARNEDPCTLHLMCADTGIGIARENLERIFEKGYSTKLEHGNMGIGLHWCAMTIGALGGRIWATSDGLDRGATLHLVIPVPATDAGVNTRAA